MSGSAQAEWMRRLPPHAGSAALCDPQTVTAAFARASQCMSTLPPNMSSATEPMPRFDPAAVTVHQGIPVDPGPTRGWISPSLSKELKKIGAFISYKEACREGPQGD
jgi:hypothetical protein